MDAPVLPAKFVMRCAQLTAIFGEQEARTLLGLPNTLVLFGGSKDVAFNQEISDLFGPVRIARTSYQGGKRGGKSITGEDIPILTAAEVRQLQERRALVVAENGKPMIAKLTRCIDGTTGRALLIAQTETRQRIGAAKAGIINPAARTIAALVEARRRGIATTREEDTPA